MSRQQEVAAMKALADAFWDAIGKVEDGGVPLVMGALASVQAVLIHRADDPEAALEWVIDGLRDVVRSRPTGRNA